MTDETTPDNGQTDEEIAKDRSEVGSLALEVTTDGGEFPMRLVVVFADTTLGAIRLPMRLDEAIALGEVLLGSADLVAEAQQPQDLRDLPVTGQPN